MPLRMMVGKTLYSELCASPRVAGSNQPSTTSRDASDSAQTNQVTLRLPSASSGSHRARTGVHGRGIVVHEMWAEAHRRAIDLHAHIHPLRTSVTVLSRLLWLTLWSHHPGSCSTEAVPRG
jgi:hypothetical protein